MSLQNASNLAWVMGKHSIIFQELIFWNIKKPTVQDTHLAYMNSRRCKTYSLEVEGKKKGNKTILGIDLN